MIVARGASFGGAPLRVQQELQAHMRRISISQKQSRGADQEWFKEFFQSRDKEITSSRKGAEHE
jgi:hypothetical protein